jgi:hypothetical protein
MSNAHAGSTRGAGGSPSVCGRLSSSLDPSARDSRTKCVTIGCQESRILIRDYGGPKATKRCNAHRAKSGKRANCADDIDQCPWTEAIGQATRSEIEVLEGRDYAQREGASIEQRANGVLPGPDERIRRDRLKAVLPSDRSGRGTWRGPSAERLIVWRIPHFLRARFGVGMRSQHAAVDKTACQEGEFPTSGCRRGGVPQRGGGTIFCSVSNSTTSAAATR